MNSVNDVLKNQDDVYFSPNPATNELIVQSSKFKVQRIEVMNMLGEKCFTPTLSKGEGVRIDVSSLPAGIYFITITYDEGNKAVRKVVKM